MWSEARSGRQQPGGAWRRWAGWRHRVCRARGRRSAAARAPSHERVWRNGGDSGGVGEDAEQPLLPAQGMLPCRG